MRAIFIRHGQSTGNAGIPCHDLALLELTELGWQQAKKIAFAWTERPNLIVTSPYLRAQQTATPTIESFQNVPVEVWPIQEFTYLQPSRWNGTLSEERMPHILRYWDRANPNYCDGDGAESFGMLLRRAERALERLQALSEDTLVYAFSHGQFIQAIRSVIMDKELTDQEKMQQFWRKGEPPAIRNCQLVSLEYQAGNWQVAF